MNLTHSDVQSILKIIDAAEHLNEIKFVHNGFELHVVRQGGATMLQAPAAQSVSAPPANVAKVPAVPARPAAAPAADVVSDGGVAIRAPMLGTFYRASGPGEKPFVEVGQRVRADDTVCLIEVMKLFNSIRAGVDGTVTKIFVENGSLVEFDQALIVVTPST
jgi:acetyl-CoA carboxylase biotin carboxyl carrier protein